MSEFYEAESGQTSQGFAFFIKMKRILLVLAMLQIAETGRADNRFMTLLVPESFVSTKEDHIHLVGKTDAGVVAFYVNGERKRDIVVNDSIFHAKAEFRYGLNRILLNPIFKNDSAEISLSLRLEVLSAPEISSKFEKMYVDYKFHNDESRTECIVCHKKASGSLTMMKEASICLDCHTDFRAENIRHVGDKELDCIICHGNGSEKLSSLPEEAEGNICFLCHSDKIKSFDQTYIHGPVAGGSCTVCHNPHGSKFPKNLVQAPEVLCFSCHDFEYELQDQIVRHEPFETGNCRACHDPHSTSNKWILVKSSEEICLTCHETGEKSLEDHRHPYNVKPSGETKKGIRLTEDGMLECISCHDPHASQSEHLLLVGQGESCFGCHSEK